ncbi:hypothetical protein KJ966_22240 [bacterium]|nr:hypothetical protein [bacterium]
MVFCCASIVDLSAKNTTATGISIEKITVGEDRIDTGRTQLIEILVKNSSSASLNVAAKLSIVLPNHNVVSFGDKGLSLGSKSETRILFLYPIDKNRGGDYTVGAKIYSDKGKVLAQNLEKEQKYFFAVDPTRRNQKPARPEKTNGKEDGTQDSQQSKTPAQPLVEFDPPDLVIKEISVLNNNSILRGESAHIRLVISNEGGDIATNVNYSIYWYFAPRINRKKNSLNDVLKIIAPGEQKVIEVPITIPEIELKGEYFVYAIVDEANTIQETDENNNSITTKESIIFSDIALVFPDNLHSFAEDGLFKFQWRSKKFNQFKVQISSNELFSDLEEVFELPKGTGSEGWTPADIIKPLSGEMPAMALALMESNGIDFLFWRVIAKDSEGNTTDSSVRKFYISLKADL